MLLQRACASRCLSAARPKTLICQPSTAASAFVVAPAALRRSAPAQRSHAHIVLATGGGASESSYEAPSEAVSVVEPEADIPGMTKFLDSLKWDKDGLVAVVCQHVDSGELLMQAFADRAALNETLQTGLATFYSRSRRGRWCKGETSGHYINVQRLFADCDGDSIVYMSSPIGPTCHTGSKTCWFSEVILEGHEVRQAGVPRMGGLHSPHSTLMMLERTIQERKEAMKLPMADGKKPSWTARLLDNPTLLCSKVREEAGELCETLEKSEGPERAASEMADLLYHGMVLMNLQGVSMEEVLRVLRLRFSQSGVEEKAARRMASAGGSREGGSLDGSGSSGSFDGVPKAHSH